MGKRFGEILTDSWKEYKDNWKVYSKMMLLLSVIPFIIVFLIEIFFMRDILFYQYTADGTLTLATIFSMRFLLFVILTIITAILGVWLQASLLYNSLYRKKHMNVKESLFGGKKYFWRYLGLTLLIILIIFIIAFIVAIIITIGVVLVAALGIANPISIIIVLILILLVIAAIIFALYLGINWTFSVYILIGENKRILDSLKLSKMLVRGRWWKTLGYLILFGLILIGVYIIVMIIVLLINVIINPGYLSSIMAGNISLDINSNLFIINQIVKNIFIMILTLIITPFSIVFIKNLYLSWKGSKK